jgi:hypothetical protein
MIARFRTASAIAALGLVFSVQPFAVPGVASGAPTARFVRGGVVPTLAHLRGIGEIRDWFNAGNGHVRLILLLSPT